MSERIYVLDYDYVELTEAEAAEVVPPVSVSALLTGKAVLRGRLTGIFSKPEGPAMAQFRVIIGAPNWQPGTVYQIGDSVLNDDFKQYECTVAGTSAAVGALGPVGTEQAITDNTVTWKYIRQAAIILDTHDLILRESEYVDAPWMFDFEMHMRPSRRTGVATTQYHFTAVASARLESPVLGASVLLPLEGAYAMIVALAEVNQLHVVYHPDLDTGSLTCLTYVLEALL